MFHFKLKHVKGATFPPDGLSRREPQRGDEVWENNEDGLDENPSPENHEEWDYDGQQPLEFDEFKDDIDERGGYLQEMVGSAVSLDDFNEDLATAIAEEQEVRSKIHHAYEAEGLVVPQYLLSTLPGGELLLPRPEFKDDPAKHRI
jgi:hypothetical protein